MRLACLLLLLTAAITSADYPQIQRLSPEDELFRQMQADISDYLRALNRGRPALPAAGSTAPAPKPADLPVPPLRFFSLERPKNMDLFALAARLNLPYATLATLNAASGPAPFSELDRLVVPNLPGLFVPEKPLSSFEEILVSITANTRRDPQSVVALLPHGARRYAFYPGADFSAVERAFFLNILFRFPLALGWLTSSYGPRPNPFTGSPDFHHGVDIAAPQGMEVLAARDGRVERAEFDPVLGNVIVLSHEGGYQTVYGHLSVILVGLWQQVRSGMIIGRVGSTGQSTGAHLHFAVSRKGSSRDPLPLLPPGKGR